MKLLWVFFLLISQSLLAQRIKDRMPNIIYIFADDMGYGELGCYGQQKIKTPHLDKLAAEGILFTQHYSSAPVCAPSRCMLMTGKHAGHSYIRGNYELGGFADDNERGQMPLPEGSYTLAHMLKQKGYATAMIGKWGLGMSTNSGNPNKQGFDYYYGYLDQKQAHNFYPTHLWENGKWDILNNPVINVHRPIPRNSPDSAFLYYQGKDYSVTKMAGKTLAYIRAHKEHPFFLYLPYTGPHVSLQAPEAAIKKYIGQFTEKPYYGEKGYAPSKYPLSTYAAMITYMDEQIGRIMSLLKELNLDNNTLVMFSSDNGTTFDAGGVDVTFFNLTGGLRGRKQDLYEGGIRVPFIARWPGKIPEGKITDHISVQYDLLATAAELVQATVPSNDGISFLPTLLGKIDKQKQHPDIYFEFPEKGGQVAIRMGKWKAVKSNMKKNSNAAWEIYDLLSDRNETTDVAEKHPELVIQFEAIMHREHQQATIKEWEFIQSKLKKN